ncbi:MAG: hypothetical protein ACK5TK_14480, partial [Betaproteobacteria bacterium]
SKTMRLAGQDRLRIAEKTPTLEARVQLLRSLFKALACSSRFASRLPMSRGGLPSPGAARRPLPPGEGLG